MFKRALTAALGIPVVFLIVYNSSEKVFFIFVLLVTALSLNEFYCMALSGVNLWGRLPGIILGCLVMTSVFLKTQISSLNGSSNFYLTEGSCALCFITLFFYHIIFTDKIEKAFTLITIKIFGIFYVALLFSYVIVLRAHPGSGTLLLWFLIFITWAGDTGAYIIGSWKGKRLLCRHISPKKTVEGALGSIVSGVLTALICRAVFLQQMDIIHCLILGAGINIMNQFGDLSESMIKRAFGAKNSGSFLPGHGGMLDRIDSFLFAAPFLFYYVKIVLSGT